mgnify:CR=1 FL=1
MPLRLRSGALRSGLGLASRRAGGRAALLGSDEAVPDARARAEALLAQARHQPVGREALLQAAAAGGGSVRAEAVLMVAEAVAVVRGEAAVAAMAAGR